MNNDQDKVRRALKKVGHLQEKILLWLGSKQGVTTLEELRQRWPETETVRTPSLAEMAAANSFVGVLSGQTEARRTRYAPYLTRSYFLGQKSEDLESEGWVRWVPKELAGEARTSSASTSLSKALRKLEDRKLVELARAAGKGTRVTHVKLSFYGEVASVLLRWDEGSRKEG